jgi:hypothetical protein
MELVAQKGAARAICRDTGASLLVLPELVSRFFTLRLERSLPVGSFPGVAKLEVVGWAEQ